MRSHIHFLGHLPAWLDLKLGLYVLTTVVGVTGVISSWAYWYHLTQSSSEVVVDQSNNQNGTPVPSSTLILEVNGAVAQPGVYTLQYGDRVAQALELAGGLLPQADASYVAKQLSLAEFVIDGQKIYIPFEEQIAGDTTVSSGSDSSGARSSININTASLSELDQLPGIGMAKAEQIIQLRPITSLSELINAKVITAEQAAELQGKIQL